MHALVAIDPLSRLALQLASAAWLGSEIVIGARGRLPDPSRARDRGSRLAIVATMLVSVWLAPAAAFGLPAATLGWDQQLLFGAGLVLMVAGIALRWYAVRVLGSSFSTLVAVGPDQRVVQRGPYRYVRHPAYSGSLLTLFGFCLAFTNWAALAAMLPGTLGFAYRIRVEEQALATALGDPYRAYMRRTKRLIPYLV